MEENIENNEDNIKDDIPEIKIEDLEKINVLIIGNSLRELILASQIKQSSKLQKLYYLPIFSEDSLEKDEMNSYAQLLHLPLDDHAQILKFCLQLPIHLVILGSIKLATHKLVAYFHNKNIAVFPTIENGESFYHSRIPWLDLFKRQTVHTPGNSVFDNPDSVMHYVSARTPFPIVAKNDDLLDPLRQVCYNEREVNDFVNNTMKKSQEENNKIILEKHIDNPILSFVVWTVNHNIVVFPYVRQIKFDSHSNQEYFECGYIKYGHLDYRQYQNIERSIITPIVDGLYNHLPNFQGFLTVDVLHYRIPYILDVRLNLDIDTILSISASLNCDWLDLILSIRQKKFDEKMLQWTKKDSLFLFFDTQNFEMREQLELFRKEIPKTSENIRVWQARIDQTNRKKKRTTCVCITSEKFDEAYQTFGNIWQQAKLPKESFISYKMEDLWKVSQAKLIPSSSKY